MSYVERAAAGPYKGLAPFGDSELDALLFFGREREREIVVANLIAARLTVLYGPSGVGKSSLLRAGVARTLGGLPERPVVAVFSSWAQNLAEGLATAVCEAAGVPPVGSLRDAVAAVRDRDVYLILDQTEEYFLYHGEGEQAFEDELVSAITEPLRVNVLLALREDSLAKLDRFKGRIPNLFGNSLRLDRLDRAAGRAAIVLPLERWNVLEGARFEIEPDLVETVLDGVGAGQIEQGLGGVGGQGNGRPAGIEAPYLQLVMRRLWEVERADGSERLRATTLAELGGAARIVAGLLERAVDELTGTEKDVTAELSRYLVTPSGTKIAHSIPDLAEYAGVPEEKVRSVARILVERRILRPSDGGRYEIYHDVLASEVLAWRTRYLAERTLERERAASRKRHRRLMILVSATMAALAAMATVTVYAFAKRRDARAQAILAHARELDATALGRLPNDPELSLLLAREAARLAPSPEVENVLRDALRTSRIRWVVDAGRPIVSASFDREGRRILVASDDGRARLYDASSHRLLRTLDHGGAIRAAAFSRDGSLVVTAGRDGKAKIWSSEGDLVRSVTHGAPIQSASFNPDGGLLLTAGGHAAKLWRVRAGGLAAALRTPKPVTDAAFSQDGGLVVVVARDRLARLFRVDGTRGATFDQGATVTSAAFSPDDRMLVTTGRNRAASLWSLHNDDLLRRLIGHVGRIRAASFSARGARLATASQDGTARVWSVVSPGDVVQLVGHTNPVVDVEFSADGQFVVTASTDGTARVWTAEKGHPSAVLAGDTDSVLTAVFSPDGRFVLTGSEDGTARLWESGTQPELIPTGEEAPTPPATEARTADGTTAHVLGNDVELTGPYGPQVLKGHHGVVDAVAFSPDGRQLVTSSRDDDARVWDVRTGSPVHRLHAHFGAVVDARFSPDGRWIVTAGPKNAGLWDAATGDFLGLLRGPTSLLTAAAFGSDSRTILTAERNGTVRRYLCDFCGTMQELLKLADTRLAATGRNLTPEERRRYGG